MASKLTQTLKAKWQGKNSLQRFLYWKQTFWIVFNLYLTSLLIPVIAAYKYGLKTGFKIQIIAYIIIFILMTIGKHNTDKADKEYLQKHKAYKEIKIPTWLQIIFWILRTFLIYIIIKIWVTL